MIRICILITFMACSLFAQEESGTIRGRVVDAATGQPLANRPVIFKSSRATTDADGRYEMDDALPGRGLVMIGLSDQYAGDARRAVSVAPGKTLVVDFRIYPGQSVSGRVTDENGEPFPGVEVVLIGREYFMGGLRYYRRSRAVTDDDGRYKLQRQLASGAGWLVWARTGDPRMPAISDEPADLSQRRSAVTPTFFPNARLAGEATVIPLRAGEQRDNVNIRMRRSPSLCAEAQVELPDKTQEARFWIEGAEPLFRTGALGGTTGSPSGGPLNPDGRLRICGLTMGDYRLSVFSGDVRGPDFFGSTQFSIADEDVAAIQVHALPRIPLPGTIVWAGEPPPNPIEGQVSVRLNSMDRVFPLSIGRARPSFPGDFELTRETPLFKTPPGHILGEYAVHAERLPHPVYVRDIFYGGTSVLRRPLTLGSELAGSALRIVLDHDGGAIRALVRNEDGEPIADATVVAVPKTSATHVQLAGTRVAGRTDQNGEYTADTVAPDEYLVMALEGDYTDLSPETIETLFNARSRATEVNVGPNATIDVELEVRRLER